MAQTPGADALLAVMRPNDCALQADDPALTDADAVAVLLETGQAFMTETHLVLGPDACFEGSRDDVALATLVFEVIAAAGCTATVDGFMSGVSARGVAVTELERIGFYLDAATDAGLFIDGGDRITLISPPCPGG